MVSAGTGFRGGNCQDGFCPPALRFLRQRAVGFVLLSEIFADDLAIELFPMWPFEQQPELGFKPFTNRRQFGQDNGLPSCECRVGRPAESSSSAPTIRTSCGLPAQRAAIECSRSVRPSTRCPVTNDLTGSLTSGGPRAESFGIEVSNLSPSIATFWTPHLFWTTPPNPTAMKDAPVIADPLAGRKIFCSALASQQHRAISLRSQADRLTPGPSSWSL